MVAVNEAGLRIGEDHPLAKLTDAEVELIRQLHDEGMRYEQLAEKFEVSKWAVGRICRFEMRAQTPMAYKTVTLARPAPEPCRLVQTAQREEMKK